MEELAFKPKYTFLYILIAAVAIVLLAVVFYYGMTGGISAIMFDALMIGIILLGILGLIATFLKYLAVNYSITEHEVIMREGIITKTKRSVPFSKIDNITIRRSIRDIILDTGTVHIDTPGGPGNAIEMHFVDAGKLVKIEEIIKGKMRSGEERHERGGLAKPQSGRGHEQEPELPDEDAPAEERPAKKKKKNGKKAQEGQETL